MAHAVAVPSPSSAMKRRRKEEVYRLAYINCIKPVPFRNLQNIPANNGCLEEKSIADLMHEQTTIKNPFEVVRKPPKKRKKVEESCFFNEALNLETAEKKFNPYEVPRADPVAFEKENHSFVNPALNLKAPDHQVLNPFEIVRPKEEPEDEPVEMERPMVGIENPALDVKLPIAIAVPFTPTIHHRIDFGQLKTPEPPSQQQQQNQATNDQLTPSEMLCKKLVFSPKEQNCGTPKRLFGKSLSMISEEGAVDIDEELDCYQLQLENSINEAKLNNRKYFTDIRRDVLKKTVTSTRTEISTKTTTTTTAVQGATVSPPAVKEEPEARVLEIVEPMDENGDCEVVDDSFDDDLPAQPFKRAFVRPTTSQPRAQSELMPPPSVAGEPKTKTDHEAHGLKGVFRRSIRMITKPKNKKTTSKEDVNEPQEGKGAANGHPHTIMSSIRRSLRKRRCRPEDFPTADMHDMSVIIDGSRSVFKDPTAPKILKHSSSSSAATSTSSLSSNQSEDKVPAMSMIRNSIRRGKNNLMKNIMHKTAEDYSLD